MTKGAFDNYITKDDIHNPYISKATAIKLRDTGYMMPCSLGYMISKKDPEYGSTLVAKDYLIPNLENGNCVPAPKQKELQTWITLTYKIRINCTQKNGGYKVTIQDNINNEVHVLKHIFLSYIDGVEQGLKESLEIILNNKNL